MKRLFLFLSACLLAGACTGGFGHLTAYPFEVKLGAPVSDSLEAGALGDPWSASTICRDRIMKRDGIPDEHADRMPEFGTLVFDHYLDRPLNFISGIDVNIPLPSRVKAFCSVGSNQGRITSFTALFYLTTFEEVCSAIKPLVGELTERYGKYSVPKSIDGEVGMDFSSLQVNREGAFLWKSHGYRVELFVNGFLLQRREEMDDMPPMDRYEVVLRYRK